MDYIFGSFLCILESFLKVKVQNVKYFFEVAKIPNIFMGCLKFLIFFMVNGRCRARAYVCRKNRVPPGVQAGYSTFPFYTQTKPLIRLYFKYKTVKYFFFIYFRY